VHVLLALLGLLGGFLAGLMGLGGGIILAPLLLYGPPLFGLPGLEMKLVARLTMFQSLFSTAAAGIAHRRARLVNPALVRWMGSTIVVASVTGAYVSEAEAVSSDLVLGLFAALALLAAVLMLWNASGQRADEDVPVEKIEFSRPKAVAVAASVGLLGGMVGQTGAFMTIPLLVRVLGIPVRVAIGSSLGITFCAAVAGSLGKLAGGGLVDWTQLAALLAGSIAGSQLGAALSQRTPTRYLRYALAICIALAAARMWYEVLVSYFPTCAQKL